MGWKKIYSQKTVAIFENFSEEHSNFAYAEGIWTFKELLPHFNGYPKNSGWRTLRFARRYKTELSGWSEEGYAKHYFSTERTLKSVVHQFENTRKSTLICFKNLNQQHLSETGIANKNSISVKTLRKLVFGQNSYHLQVINRKYLLILEKLNLSIRRGFSPFLVGNIAWL